MEAKDAVSYHHSAPILGVSHRSWAIENPLFVDEIKSVCLVKVLCGLFLAQILVSLLPISPSYSISCFCVLHTPSWFPVQIEFALDYDCFVFIHVLLQ